MKKVLYLILSSSIMISSAGYAQFGGLKDKLKDKATSKPSDNSSSTKSSDNPSSGSSGGSEKSSSKSSGKSGDNYWDPNAAASKVQPDFKQNPFPPTVLLSSILDDGLRMDMTDKAPYFYIPEVVFLPTKDVSGAEIDYKKERLIFAEIKQGDKVVMNETMWPIGSKGPVTSINKNDYTELQMPSSGLDAGMYTANIRIGAQVIFSMPFEVVVVKNDDPYATVKEIRMLDGVWSKYGFYTFENDGVMVFNTFETDLNKKLGEKKETDVTCMVEQQLYFNGKPLSKLEKTNYTSYRGKWMKQHLTFPLMTGSGYLKKDDLKDGSYIVKMKVNGVDREYPFSIKDGKPVLADLQDKTKTTDTAKAFEGMNKEFWVMRAK